MTYCLHKKSPISHKEWRLLKLLGNVLPCVTLPVVLKWSTTQVRVCRHTRALDPAPATSVTHRGRCPYPSWGNGIEKKPAVKQNCLVTQSCLTHSDPMDCSPPGFSVHGILQARILEWVEMPSSRRSFPPREPPRKVGKDTALLWNQPEARMGNYGLTTSLSEVTEAGGAGRARGRLGPALCAAELTPELLPGPR